MGSWLISFEFALSYTGLHAFVISDLWVSYACWYVIRRVQERMDILAREIMTGR